MNQATIHRETVARVPATFLSDLEPWHFAIIDQPQTGDAGTVAVWDGETLTMTAWGDTPEALALELARLRNELGKEGIAL